MKYTQEQLEAMSDPQLNKLVAKTAIKGIHGMLPIATILANEGIDYCSNPNDMMPLAFDAGLSLVYMDPDYEAHSLCNGDEENNTQHNNGLRALAIVWILVKQGE